MSKCQNFYLSSCCQHRIIEGPAKPKSEDMELKSEDVAANSGGTYTTEKMLLGPYDSVCCTVQVAINISKLFSDASANFDLQKKGAAH